MGTDQPAFLALFNLVVALAGDFGVGVALSLTETLTRYGLHDKLEDMADCEEVMKFCDPKEHVGRWLTMHSDHCQSSTKLRKRPSLYTSRPDTGGGCICGLD